ncbi:MAG: LysM peptidoglycan-binding domain-containing protein [Myxococcaceae bacterium]
MSYTVRSGDTLSAIASQHHVSLAALEKANPQIHNPNVIYVGEQINLPGSKDTFHPHPGHKPQPKPKPADPVKKLQGDLSQMQKAGAAAAKDQRALTRDTAAGKQGQAKIAAEKQSVIDQLSDTSSPPDAGTEAKLLQQLVTLGRQSAQLSSHTAKLVGADKKHLAADRKTEASHKKAALKELKPAEYKMNLAQTNHARKELGLKPVNQVIRPPMPKTFKPLTPAQFQRIAPNLGSKAASWTKYLNEAMVKYHIDTPKREAAFIAQITEETAGMDTLVEYGTGEEYNNRPDLGNTHPGDGPRFKGRGAIQLTGRFNYIKYGKEMGLDLVDHPSKAADPSVAFKIAGQYWVDHGLNHLADTGDFLEITKRINGGTHGLASREAYWAKAKHVLGI